MTTLRFDGTGQPMAVPLSSRTSEVTFGNVTVSGAMPSDEAVAVNIERSTQALARITSTLKTPGIALEDKTDVAQYAMAEGETGIFIRRLNGRTDRGTFVDGRFQVIE